MDLVNLMYKYINRFINSDELIKELENIDLVQYSEKEIEMINQLILDVKKIKEISPNEFDEIERKRMAEIERVLEVLENAKINEKIDEKTKEFLEKQYNQLLKDKEKVREGGKLYDELFNLLTNNDLINKYTEKMSDKELLEFITKYISVPMPPEITQEEFNNLVSVGIKEDKREALWRLAFNYNRKNIDFLLIEDYFIEKRDDYYLAELIRSVGEDLDIDKLIDKIIATKDKTFINGCIKRGKDMAYMFTDEQIKKISDV